MPVCVPLSRSASAGSPATTMTAIRVTALRMPLPTSVGARRAALAPFDGSGALACAGSHAARVMRATIAGAGTGARRVLRAGDPTPDFTLRDLDGREWRLRDELEGITILTWIRGEW